jgi:dTDP-4-amino-4,6-dideoxygalactose transaminase
MYHFPTLPVFGWSAYAGPRDAPLPGVTSAGHQLYTLSGSAAIALALHLLGAKPGAAVLVPTYHCRSMVAPVVSAGLRPLFYPLTPAGTPDFEWLARADLSGVHAILAAHYFGFPQPMSSLRGFCDAHGIALIEDCAHAFFGASEERPVGSWGDVAIASLTKFFPVPEGGIIASATRPLDALQLAPRSLRAEIRAAAFAIEMGAHHQRFPGLNRLLNGVFGLKSRLRASHRRSQAKRKVEQLGKGDLIRMLPAIRPAAAARWIVQTAHVSRIVDLRRRNYLELVRLLTGLPGTRVMQPLLPEGTVPYVFPLYVEDAQRTYPRLRAAGIPIFCWDRGWPGTPVIEHDCGLDWATHVFQLGCHQDLSLDDMREIATIIVGIIAQHRKPA